MELIEILSNTAIIASNITALAIMLRPLCSRREPKDIAEEIKNPSAHNRSSAHKPKIIAPRAGFLLVCCMVILLFNGVIEAASQAPIDRWAIFKITFCVSGFFAMVIEAFILLILDAIHNLSEALRG